MAVQQNKKSHSKRGMHRSHDGLEAVQLSVEPTSGEKHRRHHISPSGFLSWQESAEYQKRSVSIQNADEINGAIGFVPGAFFIAIFLRDWVS